MIGETVIVLTGTPILDPYSGLPTGIDWATPAERAVTTTAPLEPRPSSEPVQDARNAIVSGWTLYLPAGDPITAANQVRVRGVDYPVQGEPADWGVGVVVQAFRTAG